MGESVHLRVKMDVNKIITRFVSITKGWEKEWYQVKYKKLPIFCGSCGFMGHWHHECSDGIHDEAKLGSGGFILADGGRGRRRGRGSSQGTGGDQSSHDAFPGGGRGTGSEAMAVGVAGWETATSRGHAGAISHVFGERWWST